jgi:nucleotide-binding universal stress UspA family protein
VLLQTPPPRSERTQPWVARGFQRRGRLVIVGCDGSPNSRHAVDVAEDRAGPTGTVLAVHVLPPAPSHLGTPYYEHAVEESHRRGSEILRQLRDERTSGARLETELVHGTPAEALARLARSRKANEIVIGSRGLGRWRSLVESSVSHKLLRLADRPVLVVPSRAVDASARGRGSRDAHDRREHRGRPPRAGFGSRRPRGAER